MVFTKEQRPEAYRYLNSTPERHRDESGVFLLDASGKMNDLGHDAYALGVHVAHVGVFKQTHEFVLDNLLYPKPKSGGQGW